MDQVKNIGTTAPQPPTTIIGLEIWLSRYQLLLHHLFTEPCDLYRRVSETLDQLHRLRRRIESSHTSGDTQAKLCAHIIWELTNEANGFFTWVVTQHDFDNLHQPYAKVEPSTETIVTLHNEYPVDYPLNIAREQPQPHQQRQGSQNSRGGQQRPTSGPHLGPADIQRLQMSRQHRLFRDLLEPIPAENRRRLRLGDLLRSQNKSLQWFADTVGLGPMDCCNSQIFGACSGNCQRHHGIVLDDNKVRQALPVLRLALQRHIPRSTSTP